MTAAPRKGPRRRSRRETRSKKVLDACDAWKGPTQTRASYTGALREATRQKRAMKVISIAEFCSRYRISRRTVWNWVRKGRLQALRDSGGRIFRLIDPEWPVLVKSSDPDLVMWLAALKPGQVAALLEVHPATVRKFVRQGRLKAVQVGSQRRFSLAEVRRMIAERTLGHKPRNRQETSQGIVRWAKWKLGLPENGPVS